MSFFESHRQLDAVATESGGILLGRQILGTDDVIIDEAADPAPGDVRSRFRFVRRAKSAQAVVDAAWQASRGSRNYLGEWHSHPEDVPSPSPADIKNWRKIAQRARFEQTFLLFVIVGKIEISVWELTVPSMMIDPLERETARQTCRADP
jgi:integrative and conjugative element protein (TIGR02256 family)